MAATKRERDMACQPGSSRGSARLIFFFNTHCVGANGFAECLWRSSGGCYAHAFFLRRLCRELFLAAALGSYIRSLELIYRAKINRLKHLAIVGYAVR
jgi:hypothetical protein